MKTFLIFLLSITILSGCSTRQEGPNFRGSTEQRLVTYSINEMLTLINNSDLELLENKMVFLKSHFVVDNQVLHYAHQRLKMELAQRLQAQLVNNANEADYQLDMFFTSLGTDRDSSGLSIPIVNLSDPEQSTLIPLLAVDMYHGIAEGYFYITNLKSSEIVKKGKIHSRVRSDKFSTPFFSFPISNIDD